ncbi:uncharacterized protein EI90DRAFT_3027094 [Cantharellus anzutake]|uniref:uncharacterized protein n=1 Tax=Cantharellus anzutake TaxID=1750568 RepID=UPI00190749DD|nr:uncharacterized protein EI90DRAFT_3027094 [Cantharellus anzutake]KAF8343783.1 hypothetical protein EI90DRAFT_3027094 [Cantharellus anzutake]
MGPRYSTLTHRPQMNLITTSYREPPLPPVSGRTCLQASTLRYHPPYLAGTRDTQNNRDPMESPAHPNSEETHFRRVWILWDMSHCVDQVTPTVSGYQSDNNGTTGTTVLGHQPPRKCLFTGRRRPITNVQLLYSLLPPACAIL